MLNQKEAGGRAFFYKHFTPAGGDEQIRLTLPSTIQITAGPSHSGRKISV